MDFLLLIIGLIFIVVMLLMARHYNKKFDELQQLRRSTAFKYGFFILVTYNFIDSMLKEKGYIWCDFTDSFMIGLMLCMFFITLYLIITDSYVCKHDNAKAYYVFMYFIAILGVAGIITLISHVVNTGIFIEGMLSQSFILIILNIMYLIVAVTYIIKYICDKKSKGKITE